jgi:2-polyprenyl-6-methoxyphenol hydroxylase-like FAD-dependent oxidoreductase
MLENGEQKKTYWNICPECSGWGKKNTRLRKKAILRYQIALQEFEKAKKEGRASSRPKLTQYLCEKCKGSGLMSASCFPKADFEKFPHVSIIGAGIGGIALAVACLHRGIPFTLYERDTSFDARAQGYGLTLQQASNAIWGLGLFSLNYTSNSTRHVVHTIDGKEITEWGMRTHSNVQKSPKRKNVHIPRQALRLALLEQLKDHDAIQWGHRLIGYKQCADKTIELSFQVSDKIKKVKTDVLVGADGIRSVVRNLLIGEDKTPLHYLGYMVVLGICPLNALQDLKSPLLDLETVFQTVNGKERIYVMPYASNSIMWQLSFPMSLEEAKALSMQGASALKESACRIANWHMPIPQMLQATPIELISGYPVYDRALLDSTLLENAGAVTLIGDAAHPMSPFKGQGANQALLDALCLARTISSACAASNWKDLGIRETVLVEFEEEMLERSASKVKDSAEAVEFLHSKEVLREGNEPKGRVFKKKKSLIN